MCFRIPFLLCVLCTSVVSPLYALEAGFGEADITPKLGGKPVYLAGFGHDRPATEILDPMAVRAFVLRDGDKKIAFATADVVGLFLPSVERVRKELPGYAYVMLFAAITLVLLVRPRGLFGARGRE